MRLSEMKAGDVNIKMIIYKNWREAQKSFWSRKVRRAASSEIPELYLLRTPRVIELYLKFILISSKNSSGLQIATIQ